MSLIAMSNRQMKANADIIAVVTVKEKMPARWSTPDAALPKGIQIYESVNENGETEEFMSMMTNNSEFIYADLVLEVNEVYKGENVPKYILLRAGGGTVGDFTWRHVEGCGPEDYELGEKYLVYVEEDSGYANELGPNHYGLVYPFAKYDSKENGKYINWAGETANLFFLDFF
ncbi:hypothetical protein [Methanolapillus africanus]|uniref:hypothetical protein n=1 Tax=Methanolapillus africanus TaxID=3028297 RepID=UPI0030B8B1EB